MSGENSDDKKNGFWSNLAGLGSGLIGGITGIGNFISDIFTRNQQERLQREAWSREDTAVQRRARDLEAAGLSKTLAAGGAASSMAPVRLDSPHLNMNPVEDYLKSKAAVMNQKTVQLNQAQQMADIARTQANTEWILQQKKNAEQDYIFQEANDPQKLESARLKNAFADQTMQIRIDALVNKNTTESLRQKNIEADTKLKESGVDLNRVRQYTEAAWGAFATARTVREGQEVILRDKEHKVEYGEGGIKDMALQKAAVELQVKEFIWRKMSKEGYKWEGLGKEIEKGTDWLFKGN